ncbi:hypothetical protein E2562_019629 [Oryza meyeriana var. granulata]|uniref:Uncharacterized protein n=1 Tax=Oryza meyeriana var. granulata TaxID=110450 RepID=A0A6G1C7W4_9ORYZ|nr:hypothetical protein E2562_019629 [Oryza meyeriana var. granulata]
MASACAKAGLLAHPIAAHVASTHARRSCSPLVGEERKGIGEGEIRVRDLLFEVALQSGEIKS